MCSIRTQYPHTMQCTWVFLEAVENNIIMSHTSHSQVLLGKLTIKLNQTYGCDWGGGGGWGGGEYGQQGSA